MIKGLRVENLECQRGGRVIFSGLCFEVPPGHGLILRGANGAGKTTLLRALAGYLSPAKGQIVLTHEAAGEQSTDRTEYLHYFGHDCGVKQKLTAFENLRFWQRYYAPFDPSGDETVDAALDAFGLLFLADYRAAHLSAGQARRLGLARLLVAKRPLWILDEPLTSLDAASIQTLEHHIGAHLEGGGIAILSTHSDLKLPGTGMLHLPAGVMETLAP